MKANDEGKAELQVVSVTAGTYEITASAGNDQPSNAQSVTFVADKTTATISSIEVIGNRAVADGKTKQTYKVTVTDANNNLLKDSEVTLTASPAKLVLDPNGTATTNEQGQAIFTATTTVAATYTLTAQVSQNNGQVSTKPPNLNSSRMIKRGARCISRACRFSGGGREDYCNTDGYSDVGCQPRRRNHVGRH